MTANDAGVTLAVSTVIFALRPDRPTALPSLWVPLVRRIRPPYQGHWALPGGPLRADEDLETSAARTLAATTALAPSYLEQLYAFGTLDRSPLDERPGEAPEPRERVVSIVYWALVNSAEVTQSAGSNSSENVAWFSVDDLPPLAFDHNSIVEYAVWRLRNKVEYSRIAHAFLGETFTLAALREVHEAVLGRSLDPANFRRQLESAGAIVPTGDVVAGTRYRPPKLYRYNSAVDPLARGPVGASPLREKAALS